MVFADDFRLKLNKILALAVTILVGLFVVLRFDIYYDLNDDIVMRDILAGIYSGTPETRNMQMLYPMSFVLAVLHSIIPIIPWYGVMLGFFQLFCLFLITERALDFCARISGKLLMCVSVICIWTGLFSYRFVFLHYTVTAGILVATAIFRFMTNYSTDPDEISFTQDTARVTRDDMRVGEFLKKNIINMILLIAAFMLRSELALLMLPFMCVAVVLKWAEEQPVFTFENFKKFGSLVLIVVAACAFLLTVDSIAYSRTNWSNFRDLFDARTEIYDFTGIPSYEENQAFYESIQVSREEYDLMTSYNYSLSDNLNYKKFVAIAEYADNLQEKAASPAERNKVAMWKYVKYYFNASYCPWVYISILLSVLVLIAALLQKQFQIIWKLILLNVFRMIPWIYIYYKGRIVERVMTPLLFVEMILLAAMLLMEFGVVVEKQNGYRTELRRMRVLSKWEERRENMVRVFPVIALLVMVVVSGVIVPEGYQKTTKEYKNREQAAQLLDKVNAYMSEHGNTYYLIDVYSSTSVVLQDSSEFVNVSKKVYADVSTNFGNYDMLGGWIVKSPLYQDKLEYAEKKVVNVKYPEISETESETIQPESVEEVVEDSADEISTHLAEYDQNTLENLKEQSYLGYQLVANPSGYQLIIRSDRDYSWLTSYYASLGITVELQLVDEIADSNTRDAVGVYQVVVTAVNEQVVLEEINDEQTPGASTLINRGRDQIQ